jgi:hypothetical protein
VGVQLLRGLPALLHVARERIGEHVKRVDEMRRQLRRAVAN